MAARPRRQVLTALLAGLLACAAAGRVAAEADAPLAAASGDVGARAAEALKALANAYSLKRRSEFMKRVSDDYTGDLGTLEDALSSDFRNYRTIDLSIIPEQVTSNQLKTQIVFRFDLNVTDDLGKLTKFSGHAAYTFVDEDGKSKLLTMDRTPIFGTSLSAAENPIPRSQGAPTASVTSAPTSCGATISGSAFLASGDGAASFDFASQTETSGFSGGDMSYSGGTFIANNGAALNDVGPCSFQTFNQDPASIKDSSDNATVGDCYAVKTRAGKYAMFYLSQLISGSSAGASILYKFQPSGQSCF